MKKKTVVLIVLAVVIALLGGIYAVVIVPLNGSLIHKALTTKKVRAYVEETYGDGFTCSKAVYNFKFKEYVCHVQSESSADTFFTVYEDKKGNLTDEYELGVLRLDNTVWRLTREMEEKAEAELLPLYPWECTLCLCDFDAEALEKSMENRNAYFTLDMPLDMERLPLPAELTLWGASQEPSWEELANAYKEALRLCEEKQWDITYYSIRLHETADDGSIKPADAQVDYAGYHLTKEEIEKEDLAAYLKRQTQ